MGWEKELDKIKYAPIPEQVIHDKPHPTGFENRNNRKMTKGRLVMATKVQSVPIYEKELVGTDIVTTNKIKGYKYIYH